MAALNSKMKPAPDFNSLAHLYRWMEYLSFGPYLWRARIALLPTLLQRIPRSTQALVLGDGDGRFTSHLLRICPSLRVHAVDASPRMLDALCRTAAQHAERLTTECADLRTWQPPDSLVSAPYGLIVSHFFLDCLTTDEVAALAGRIAGSADPGAQWLVSDFAVPPTLFGRVVAAPIVALLYRSFRALTRLHVSQLPNHGQALEAAGWRLEIEKTHLCGLLISQLWTRTGAANSTAARFSN